MFTSSSPSLSPHLSHLGCTLPGLVSSSVSGFVSPDMRAENGLSSLHNNAKYLL